MGYRTMLCLLACYAAVPAATVTINQSVTYQTILGWGAPPGLGWQGDRLLPYMVDECVNGMGLTRLRFEAGGGNGATTLTKAWEYPNDNADPESINWAGLNTPALRAKAGRFLAPFRQLVEANGEPFTLYLSSSFFDGGSTGAMPPWMLNSPGEYAEYLLSQLLFLRDSLGVEADYVCVLNEAGNNNQVTAVVIRNVIKVLGPWMRAAGLRTTFQAPECMAADQSWNYLNAYPAGLRYDSEAMRYVGLLSYHLYGSNDPYRMNIRDYGRSAGLPTGQTEYMGLNVNTLRADLDSGGTSVWEFYASDDFLPVNASRTWFSRNATFWLCRQIIQYARPGAVRVDATSNSSLLRPLAFVRGGGVTVVTMNNTGGPADNTVVSGIPDGVYCVSQTAGGTYQEVGTRTVSGGTTTVAVPANAVVTLYPRGNANQAPVLVSRAANPPYLTMPASQTTLSASGQDPELSALSYRWSLRSQPGGASPVFATPNVASTQVTGLAVAGDYVFSVCISDGTDSVTALVPLTVYSGNQPPEANDVHNRNPVIITLPTAATVLRGAGRDLENDALTYQWSILSQPSGASATLATPTAGSCAVSNMSVAGNYVFRFVVSEAGASDAETLTVPVYPANQNAPVTTSITPSPNDTITIDTLTLAAVTSDPDGDQISHWWTVTSAPAGAALVFSRQGSATTGALGLTVPGTYVFALIVVDRTRVTTRSITIVRSAATGIDKPGVPTRPSVRLGVAAGRGSPALLVGLDKPGDFAVEIFDLAGSRVYRHQQAGAAAGYYSLSWSAGHALGAGRFVAVLSTRQRRILDTFTVTR